MENKVISKELLSEVLGYKVCTDGYLGGNSIAWGMIGCRAPDDCEEYEEEINIHELAHKCKEWAFDEYYLSIITFKMRDKVYKLEVADIRDSQGTWSTKYSTKVTSDALGIIIGAQWIKDNK